VERFSTKRRVTECDIDRSGCHAELSEASRRLVNQTLRLPLQHLDKLGAGRLKALANLNKQIPRRTIVCKNRKDSDLAEGYSSLAEIHFY